MDSTFEGYILEAKQWYLSGWDFKLFKERWIEESTSWDYTEIITSYFSDSVALLDMGTGGGEFLSSLSCLPKIVCATESFKPNVPVAKKRLEPLGIKVLEFESDSQLPLQDEYFDLVINKHEAFIPSEVFRILKPGGIFLTQQVGGKDNKRLNELLTDSVENEFHDWSLSSAVAGLVDGGFKLLHSQEEHPATTFTDVGAVAVFLRAIPWQIPNFSIETHKEKLSKLHEIISRDGRLVVNSHRFFIAAQKA